MPTDTPAAPAPRPDEPGLTTERLSDGTVRMTVVTRRAGAAGILGGVAAIAAGFVLYLSFGWYRFLPPQVQIMSFLLAPLGIGVLLLLLVGPRRQTHVLEVSPAGLRVETTLAGDRVRRFHPREDIVSVGGTSTLDIHTKRDGYSCMQWAGEGVVREVVATIAQELSRGAGGATPP